MYYSISEATGTGSPQLVAVPPYLDKAHITVYIDGLATEAFTWVNAQVISLIAPANRKIRVVRRTSPGTKLTQFLNGQPLPGDNLEVDSKQAFYMAQEAYDVALAGGTVAPVVGGVELTTSGILALLEGQITPSQLELDLREKIALIDADGNTIGSPAWLAAQEAAAREGAIQAVYEAQASLMEDEANDRAAAILEEKTLRETADGLLASQINTVAALAGETQAAVQEIASVDLANLGTVSAQWTIKVQARSDGKQAIAGIGLSSTVSSNVAQSEMVFLADKFTFVPSASDINSVPQPLLVAGLVNGVNTVVIPPSRFGDQLIESRMIVNGAILARHVEITGRSTELNRDPLLTDPSLWDLSPGTSIATDSTAAGGRAAFGTNDTPTKSILCVDRIPINRAKNYRVEIDARKVSGPGATMWLFVAFFDAAGNNITDGGGNGWSGGTYHYFGLIGEVAPTSWTTYGATFGPNETRKVPTGAVKMSVGALIVYTGVGTNAVANLRLREADAHSLIVTGGVKADQIDTRGLSIKDLAGNVILSAGTALDVSRITGLGDFATLNQITAANVTTYIANAAVKTAQIEDAAIGSAKLSGTLQSDNYNAGTAGWRIRRDTGDMEVNNLTARGNITAESLTLTGKVDTSQAINLVRSASGSGVTMPATTDTLLLFTSPMNVGSAGKVALIVTVDWVSVSAGGGVESGGDSISLPTFLIKKSVNGGADSLIAEWHPPQGMNNPSRGNATYVAVDLPAGNVVYKLYLGGSVAYTAGGVDRRSMVAMGSL